ncbi:MAG: hypothetical protein A3B38_00555 [Candidatus Levybacteria bacterium RIFCSPLOWO2_01_FULL_36_13]|nr:MAG: hypothetical protein A2684_01795 [Candidatus Levybacteria bacterium RIFCSPHIGHO2_01_FULL_36_15b]OGH35378.1 MAG: hypothetical protein A3B38_00555 [Candidatus Levybacteria bacterium RIFCSPLOWO2_01_FULL_36_13]
MSLGSQRNRIIIIISLLVFVVLILTAIYFLDSFSDNSSNSTSLKNFDTIKNQAKSLASDSQINSNASYQKILSQLARAENKNLSNKEKAKILDVTGSYILDAYYYTNNHKLYLYAQAFNNFLIENIGEKARLNIPCYDPECAENPQPKEILNVIEEIKQSQLPQGLKDSVILDLTNFGYLRNGYGLPTYNIKIGSYASLANTIRKDPEFIKAGINEKIYNDIVNYLRVEYPDEYAEFIKR